MKIAIYHELPNGGARRAMNEFSNQLLKNHRVDFYTIGGIKNEEKKYYSSTRAYPFITKKWAGGNWKVRFYKDSFELFKLYLLNKKIAHEINLFQYDIVLISASQYIETPFITRFLKVPFLFYCQDPNYRLVYDSLVGIPKNIGFLKYTYEVINRKIRKALDKQNAKKVPAALSPSLYISKLFSKTYHKKCTPIYYGVDSGFFRPSTSEKDIDILYIGSHSPVDGYDLVEKTIQYLKHTIVLRTLFFEDEWISDDRELRALYQRSKMVICPARKEGLGAVPLEAMACGTPVIAVDEAGHKETVLNNKTGFLLKRSPVLFAKKIDYLLSNQKQLAKLGQAAREYMVRDWTWEKRTKELEKNLIQFIKDKKI